MLLWRVEIVDGEGLLAVAVVLAPDANSAADTALAHVRREKLSRDPEVYATRTLGMPSRVLDLHMPDPRVATKAPDSDESPRVWRVPYDDGLFQRSAGAALVIAENADAAKALVMEADPWEGRPFYGVPGGYGEAEPFIPESAYLVWIDLDWRDDEVPG